MELLSSELKLNFPPLHAPSLMSQHMGPTAAQVGIDGQHSKRKNLIFHEAVDHVDNTADWTNRARARKPRDKYAGSGHISTMAYIDYNDQQQFHTNPLNADNTNPNLALGLGLGFELKKSNPRKVRTPNAASTLSSVLVAAESPTVTINPIVTGFDQSGTLEHSQTMPYSYSLTFMLH